MSTIAKAIVLISSFVSPVETIDENELYCLTEAIYFEAGNQSYMGKYAVGSVVKNRVNSRKYPNTYCGVVRQRKQFSYYWDGKKETMPRRNNRFEIESLRESKEIAESLLRMETYYDPTSGSLFYHADSIRPPSWTRKMNVSLEIENHIFYRGE
jgi:spore germination cell wall hydrolase CwlJ-like protein